MIRLPDEHSDARPVPPPAEDRSPQLRKCPDSARRQLTQGYVEDLDTIVLELIEAGLAVGSKTMEALSAIVVPRASDDALSREKYDVWEA